MALRDILITLIILGSIPFTLRNPYWGILAWNWLAFMNPHRLTWGFAYSFQFSLVVAIATLCSLLINRNSKKIPWNLSIIFMLLLALWVVVTTFFALNPQGAFAAFEQFIKILLMVFIALAVIKKQWELDCLVWIICLSLGFYGVKGGIFTILHGGIYRVNGPPGSFIEDNNDLAFALVMTLPLIRYLQLRATRSYVRLALWGAMALTAISILGSYSRGAFVAGGSMALLLIVKSRKRLPLIISAAFLIPFMLVLMPKQWHDRMDTISNYQKDGSALGRINAWKFAWNLAKDHPMVGGGCRAFTPILFHRYAPEPDNYHDAHSIYFQMLGEQGFVGLGLFLGIGACTLFTAGSLIKLSKDNPDLIWAHDLGSMCQASFIGYAIGGAFLGLSYWDLPYTLVAIVAIAKMLARKALEKQKNQAPAFEACVEPALFPQANS
jgi:probable O-glycosylation ligase (exosortase A-associated)